MCMLTIPALRKLKRIATVLARFYPKKEKNRRQKRCPKE